MSLASLRMPPKTVRKEPEQERTAPPEDVKWLLSVDTETVPDSDLVYPEEAKERFPKPIQHKIVAISFVTAKISGPAGEERLSLEECRSGGTEDSSEKDLIRGFWRLFEQRKPRLVTWHGRGFDIPVLKARSMVHGIAVPYWHKAGDKWSNYSHRYSTDWHCDLMDVLSDQHAAPFMTLRETAEAVGIPGKINGTSECIADLFKEGRIGDIRDFCEMDALSLFGLYIRWRHMCGASSAAAHDANMQSMLDYVEQESAKRKSMAKFRDLWKASKRPSPIFVGSASRDDGKTAA